MPGFLATLVARAEGRLPLLERRPRALFEPAADAPAAPLGAIDARHASDAGTSIATPPASSDASRVATAQREDGDPRVAPSITAAVPGLLQAAPVRLPMRDTPRDGTPARHDPMARVAPATRATPPPRPAVRVIEASAPAATGGMLERHEGPADMRPRAAAPSDQAFAAAPIVQSARDAASPGGTLLRAPIPRTPAAVTFARSQGRMSERRDAPMAAAPLPVPVQISIGRVEIRAVQAGADRARGSAPAAPRLSLDDYLRGRNGAAR
jgi:hypothetical protein